VQGEGTPEESNLSADLTTSTGSAQPAPSRWGAFSSVAFTVIWTASVLSNVGTAMFDTASGWLITSLDANPMTVSLVQVAVSFPRVPVHPAGGRPGGRHRFPAVADRARTRDSGGLRDFRRVVSLDLATPALLLATTFLLGVGGALTPPGGRRFRSSCPGRISTVRRP
jgi:hypothetical protein